MLLTIKERQLLTQESLNTPFVKRVLNLDVLPIPIIIFLACRKKLEYSENTCMQDCNTPWVCRIAVISWPPHSLMATTPGKPCQLPIQM